MKKIPEAMVHRWTVSGVKGIDGEQRVERILQVCGARVDNVWMMGGRWRERVKTAEQLEGGQRRTEE